MTFGDPWVYLREYSKNTLNILWGKSWGNYEGLWGLLWRYSEVKYRLIWGHIEGTLGSLWEYSGLTLKNPRGHFEYVEVFSCTISS